MKQKLFLFVALLCMVCTGAWAKSDNPTTFEQLKEAMANGGTVTLGGNIDGSSDDYIQVSNSVTIDLNGFELKRTQGLFEVWGGITLSITDGSTNKTGKVTTPISIETQTTGNIAIYGGTFTNTTFYNGGDLRIFGGNFDSALAHQTKDGKTTYKTFLYGGHYKVNPSDDIIASGYHKFTDGSTDYPYYIGKVVAMIGTNYYISWADAYSTVQSGQTITLMSNLNGKANVNGEIYTPASISIESGKNFTIDLNGYTIGTSSTTTTITNAGTLTITNSSTEYNGQIVASTTAPGAGTTVSSWNKAIANTGTLTIQNSTTTGVQPIALTGYINVYNTGSLTYSATSLAAAYGIYNEGTATISGGELVGTYALYNNGGTSSISGGTLSNDVTAAAGTINITGGTFSTHVSSTSGTVTSSITSVPTSGGYWCDYNGTIYTLGTSVAQIGTTTGSDPDYTNVKYYTTLKNAVAAVADNQTVKLTADVTEGGIACNKDNTKYTIDLGGKTVSASENATKIFTISAGQVTLQNGTINGNVSTIKYAILAESDTLNMESTLKVNVTSEFSYCVHVTSSSAVVNINGGSYASSNDSKQGFAIRQEPNITTNCFNISKGCYFKGSTDPNVADPGYLSTTGLTSYLPNSLATKKVDDENNEYNGYWEVVDAVADIVSVNATTKAATVIRGRESLAAAVSDDSSTGNTVVMLKDETEIATTQEITKAFTLNLNGKTIDGGDAKPLFKIGTNGDLILTDTVKTATKGLIKTSKMYTNVFELSDASSKLTVDSITIYEGNNTAVVVNNGTLKVNSGVIKSGGYVASNPYSAISAAAGSTVTISGGSIMQEDGGNAVKFTTGGTYSITGGKFYGAIAGTAEKFFSPVESSSGTITSAPIFNTVPAAKYIASGYCAADNEDTETKEKYPYTLGYSIAKIGDNEYGSLKIAVADCADNTATTITMIKNAAIKDAVEIPAKKNVILDLDTYTVSRTAEAPKEGETPTPTQAFTVNSGATLTINAKSSTTFNAGTEGGTGASGQGTTGDTGAITAGANVQYAIKNAGGTLNINSGNISASTASVYATAGTTNVNGGSFSGNLLAVTNGTDHPTMTLASSITLSTDSKVLGKAINPVTEGDSIWHDVHKYVTSDANTYAIDATNNYKWFANTSTAAGAKKYILGRPVAKIITTPASEGVEEVATEYASIQDAVTTTGGTYTLNLSTYEDVTIPENRECTIDLNGKTWTNASGDNMTVSSGAKIWIKDGTETETTAGTGTMSNSTTGKSAVNNGGEAKIESGIYNGAINNNKVMTISGGTFSKDVHTNAASGWSGIFGGVFDGSLTATDAWNLKGGYFATQPSDKWCPDGYDVTSMTVTYNSKSYYKVVSAPKGTMTYYAGTSTAVTDKKYADWDIIRATTPNAMAVVASDDETAGTWAKDNNNVNVLVEYKTGANNAQRYYECPNFVLTDDSQVSGEQTANFYSPVDFIAVTGSYSRTLNASYNSVCVPFAINSGDFGSQEVLAYSTYNATERNVYFTYQTSVNAGVAVIIKPDQTKAWSKTFSNTAIKGTPVAGTSFKGVFEKTQVYTAGGTTYYSVNAGGLFGPFTAESQYLYPFRACFALDGDTSNSQESRTLNLVIEDPDVVTGINNVSVSNETEDIYTIDGRHVNSMSDHGLYIVNGKKVLK